MAPIFKIHPGIGIARVGNSDDFYLAPEQPGALPLECDAQGHEQVDNGHPVRISSFKDSHDLSLIKRQAARFKVFVYRDEDDSDGRELRLGDSLPLEVENPAIGRQVVNGTVRDIQWTVHLANKKASWYQFQETQGMHGYAPDHPLRNPLVTQPDKRRQLTIDPGPLTVSYASPKERQKAFSRGGNPGYAQSFPPADIQPQSVDTLGELIANEQDQHLRLIVLGGRGRAGSTSTPVITSYANNNGWFDDVSDGPVSATIVFDYQLKEYVYETVDGKEVVDPDKTTTTTMTGTMDVQVPAWVIVGYPRYVPEIEDMITLDEAMFDVFVRLFAFRPAIFGVPPYDGAANRPKTAGELTRWRNEAQYNTDFYPRFYRDIWPILRRPELYANTYDFDQFTGGDPHNTGTSGNLEEAALSTPPRDGEDVYRRKRQFVMHILRHRGQENHFVSEPLAAAGVPAAPNYRPKLMPLACGNNPLSNTVPDKFLRLTNTQLFLLQQWAAGKFINECLEWDADDCTEGDEQPCKHPWATPPTRGIDIDRGVLSNLLGGAFCPGGEVGWIMLNPAIYSDPYRVKHARYQAGALSLPSVIASSDGSPAADLSAGMEPGDLTKYMGLPWHADFHACDYQNIDVTYDDWINTYPASTGDPIASEQTTAYNIPWWPAHRPYVINETKNGPQVYWASGIPDNNAGSLKMVTAWNELGFVKNDGDGNYVQVERNDDALGPPLKPGQRLLGGVEQRTVNIKKSDL